MEKGNRKKFYFFSWFWNIAKHGLILLGIKNRLARIGLDFMPYYWVEEETTPVPEFFPKDNNESYYLTDLSESDLVDIKSRISGIEHKDLVAFLKEGQRCIGLKHKDQVAAYMFICTSDVNFRSNRFKIKSDEVYLHAMYVFEEFRGKRLAPYLRYSSYRLLEKEGRTKKYSVSEYFNKSTIRFKSKLNSKHRKLYLDINLFNIFKKCYLLRTYS